MPWEVRGLRGWSREAGRFFLSTVSSGKMFNVRRKYYQPTAGR
jgi:hypothetical protein